MTSRADTDTHYPAIVFTLPRLVARNSHGDATATPRDEANMTDDSAALHNNNNNNNNRSSRSDGSGGQAEYNSVSHNLHTSSLLLSSLAASHASSLMRLPVLYMRSPLLPAAAAAASSRTSAAAVVVAPQQPQQQQQHACAASRNTQHYARAQAQLSWRVTNTAAAASSATSTSTTAMAGCSSARTPPSPSAVSTPLSTAARARESTLTLVRHDHAAADVTVHRLAPLPQRPAWNAHAAAAAAVQAQPDLQEHIPRIALRAKDKYTYLSEGHSVVQHHRTQQQQQQRQQQQQQQASSPPRQCTHTPARRRCSVGSDGNGVCRTAAAAMTDARSVAAADVYATRRHNTHSAEAAAADTDIDTSPPATTTTIATSPRAAVTFADVAAAANDGGAVTTSSTPPGTAAAAAAAASSSSVMLCGAELQSASDSGTASIDTLARSGPAYARAQMLKSDVVRAFAEVDFTAALQQQRRLDVQGRPFRLARTLFSVVAHHKPYFTCDDLHDLLVLCSPAGASRAEAAACMREWRDTPRGRGRAPRTSLTFGEFVRYGARLRARLGDADAFARLPSPADKLRAIYTRVFRHAAPTATMTTRQASTRTTTTTTTTSTHAHASATQPRRRGVSTSLPSSTTSASPMHVSLSHVDAAHDNGDDDDDEQTMRVRLLEVARRQVEDGDGGALPDGVQPLRVYEHAFLLAYHDAVHRASFVTRHGVPDDLRDFDTNETYHVDDDDDAHNNNNNDDDNDDTHVTDNNDADARGHVRVARASTLPVDTAIGDGEQPSSSPPPPSLHVMLPRPSHSRQRLFSRSCRVSDGAGRHRRRRDRARRRGGSGRVDHEGDNDDNEGGDLTAGRQRSHRRTVAAATRGASWHVAPRPRDRLDGERSAAATMAVHARTQAPMSSASDGGLRRGRNADADVDDDLRERRARDDALIRRLQCNYGLLPPRHRSTHAHMTATAS